MASLHAVLSLNVFKGMKRIDSTYNKTIVFVDLEILDFAISGKLVAHIFLMHISDSSDVDLV
jgi:hypothetical protein